jgi:hypothetical protein
MNPIESEGRARISMCRIRKELHFQASPAGATIRTNISDVSPQFPCSSKHTTFGRHKKAQNDHQIKFSATFKLVNQLFTFIHWQLSTSSFAAARSGG